MPSEHARRGRPKGSGLDDRTQLAAIARLLESDPSLKPTTAIKLIGVTDPSAIRRLRDKLKGGAPGEADEGDAVALDAPVPPAVIAPARPKAHQAPPNAKPAPAEAAVSTLAITPTPLAEPAPVSEAAPVSEHGSASEQGSVSEKVEAEAPDTEPASTSGEADQPLPLFTQLCALGLQTLTSTVEAQMAVVEGMLKAPSVASVLKQQILLNEVAKAFCAPSTDVRPNSK